MLVHDIQKEFKEFVRNVRIQQSNHIYQEVEEEEVSEIKVAINGAAN